MTAVDVDALDAARAAATPGPWEHYDPADGMCWEDPADAALIVAAVNALPEMLAEVRRGRALREAVEGLAETWDAKAREWAAEADNVTVGDNRRYGLLGRILGTKAAAQRLRAVVAAVDAS